MKTITIDSVTPWACPTNRYACMECEYNKGLIIENDMIGKILKVQCDYSRMKEEEEAITVEEYQKQTK